MGEASPFISFKGRTFCHISKIECSGGLHSAYPQLPLSIYYHIFPPWNLHAEVVLFLFCYRINLVGVTGTSNKCIPLKFSAAEFVLLNFHSLSIENSLSTENEIQDEPSTSARPLWGEVEPDTPRWSNSRRRSNLRPPPPLIPPISDQQWQG